MAQQAQQPNPLLEPPFFVIPGISPSAPVSAQVQQIDQLNTLLLQEIDANFARFHQVITTRILPEIKRFAIGGEPIRESSQFWRSFFEAAAAVRVPIEGDSSHLEPSNQSTYEDETVTIPHDDSYLSAAQEDGSFMFNPPGGVVSSTPLPGRTLGGGAENQSWEDSMESPFDRMDRKLREELRLDQGYAESDMPTPSLPSGYSIQGLGNHDNHDNSYDVSTGTVEPVDKPKHSNNKSAPAPAGGETPKAKRAEQGKWNGVTDLRTTPLNAKFAKATGSKPHQKPPKQSLANTIAELSMDDSEDDIKMTMSPPVTMNFTLPPRAQAVFNTSRTPVKSVAKDGRSDAKKDGEARMILDDLMEEMGNEDSPHMPTPEAFGRYSVVPEELGSGRRLFANEANGAGSSHGPAPTRKSLANTSYGSDIIDQSHQPTPVFGDNDDSFDDDEDDSFDSAYGAQAGSQLQQQPSYSQHSQQHADESYDDITVSSAGNLSEAGIVFGGGPKQGEVPGGQFNLMRQDEIHTFFGGKLEDAAGGDVRLSPTYQHGNR